MSKYKKFQKDKNNNGVDDRLDLITNICAVVLPFTTIDQLYIIYINKQTVGVSSITWLLYGLLSIPLLVYSIKRKEVPMIILNGLWVIVDFAVWFGVVLYS
jgi:uncharacterized protein with PQ loop repeat